MNWPQNEQDRTPDEWTSGLGKPDLFKGAKNGGDASTNNYQ